MDTFCCGSWLGNWKPAWGEMLAMVGCKGLKLPPVPRPWPGGSMPMFTYCWWVAWICCCCGGNSASCCWRANCSTDWQRASARDHGGLATREAQGEERDEGHSLRGSWRGWGRWKLTVGVGKHTHERRELRRASTVGDVEAAASRPRDASGGRLLLVHGEPAEVGSTQSAGEGVRCVVRWTFGELGIPVGRSTESVKC